MPNRPSTPSDVSRQLRQEAGFGCCFCGHPFLTYHHIVPYADDQHFRPEDMMAVCDNCHRGCTNGAIPELEQRRAKQRAKNVVDGELRGQLYVTSNRLKVELAGGLAIDTPNLLEYRNTQVLGAKLDDIGRVLISAIVQNSAGIVVATLRDNEWSLNVSEVWDFECSHRWATVRSAPFDVNFEVDCRQDRVRLQGKWSLGGTPVEFTPTRCRYGRSVMAGQIVDSCGGFLRIG